LPITSVVLNNSTLGWTKHSAQNRYPDSMPVSQDFGAMHVAQMAKAMGAHGVRISDVRELRDAVAEARSLDGPSVVEVVSSPFESPVLTGGERVDAY
jgi:pyruvate dehydrogenase (quinone)